MKILIESNYLHIKKNEVLGSNCGISLYKEKGAERKRYKIYKVHAWHEPDFNLYVSDCYFVNALQSIYPSNDSQIISCLNSQ